MRMQWIYVKDFIYKMLKIFVTILKFFTHISIFRLPCFAVKLRSVNLSNNPCLGQQVLYELLDNATSNGHCALEHVDMSYCGITAPLHSDLLDSISSKLSSEMPLVKLRFSCRQLDSVDKNSLQQVWTGHWGDLGVTDFWKNQVCLSVRNSDQRWITFASWTFQTDGGDSVYWQPVQGWMGALLFIVLNEFISNVYTENHTDLLYINCTKYKH